MLCEPTNNNCFGKTVHVTRHLDKLIECSTAKGDDVKEQLKNKKTVEVHIKCRKDYTRRLEPKSKEIHGHSSHINRQTFDFKVQCIFCERNISVDVKKFRNKQTLEFSVLEILEIVKQIRTIAEKRNDGWGRDVIV